MKKTFKLKGLECANCASKIETAVSKLDGVTGVSVSFMTEKMVIEADGDKICAVETAAAGIVKKIESHVKMVEI